MIEQVKAVTLDIIKKYTTRSNSKATIQFLNTLIPYFALFYLAMDSLTASYWIFSLYMLLLSFYRAYFHVNARLWSQEPVSNTAT